MSIASVIELGRTYERDASGSQVTKAVRKFAVTLADAATPNAQTQDQILTACGLSTIGQAHPDAAVFGLLKVQVNERFGDSPYHVEVIAEYGILQNEEDVTPVSRAAKWTFESKPSQVPALFYYDGAGNGTTYPLTNSAYDYFEGLTTDESMVEATMKKNYAAFPTSQMAATNAVNSGAYFGGAAHTWKVSGINTTYTRELFGAAVVAYWATECKLMYRQTGWNLLLPDIGFNQISGGQKQRCMVFDFQNNEWVPSSNPVALSNGLQQASGRPAILTRRVYPEADFSSLFGTPPS